MQVPSTRVPDVPGVLAYRRSAPFHDLHVSNLLTYGALVGGAMAIAAAQSGDVHLSGALLAAAAIADTFDGRFARRFTRTPRQERAGGELDSLVDACVFGMAPVAVMSALAPPAGGLITAVWWLAAAAYLIAVVTRLVFFNLEVNQQAFVGLPTPAVALIFATALFAPLTWLAVVMVFVVSAVLMVAPIPIPRPRARGLALFAAWGLCVLIAHLSV